MKDANKGRDIKGGKIQLHVLYCMNALWLVNSSFCIPMAWKSPVEILHTSRAFSDHTNYKRERHMMVGLFIII